MNLPIDLIICNTLDFPTAFRTIQYNEQFFNFKNKIILSNISEKISGYKIFNVGKFNSIQEYSDFMPKLIDYTESEYILLIQDDGHIVNPNNWTESFLDFDYIGAPWPTSKSWLKRFKKYSYFDTVKKNIIKNRIGNGGFSLRSRKFLEICSNFKSCENVPEDIFFCLLNYDLFIDNGIKFADFNTAYKFSAEHSFGKINNRHPKSNPIFNVENHFGWHGKRFKNSNELINLKFT